MTDSTISPLSALPPRLAAAYAANMGMPPMPSVPTVASMDAPREQPVLPRPQVVPGEYIVGFRPDVSVEEQRQLLASLTPQEIEPLPSINGALVRVDPARFAVTDVAGIAGAQPQILFTQPNYVQHLRGGDGVVGAQHDVVRTEGATDPELAKQYHLDNTGQTGGLKNADVNAVEAWRQSRGKGVIVALADTNIDIEHPDLDSNIWTNAGEVAGNGVDDDKNGYVDDVHGWNFGKNNARPQDGGQSHGTHTAGIIAAAAGNGIAGSGVAPDVTLMPLAILTGGATTANAIKAFDYAVKNGANVISNSWGNNIYEPALAASVKSTVAAGVSVVVASGNENWDTGVHGSYPDNYAGSLSVAASDAKDAKASYSNSGTVTVDVAAPGDKVLSTLPKGKFGEMSGTSMAAPVVSGVLALVKARYPQLTMKQVEERVLRSVQRDGAAKVWSTLVASGGRVDAEAALTPLATPTAPAPVVGVVAAPVTAGTPVRVAWRSDLLEGQRFDVEVSSNAGATVPVAENFETGTTARTFRTSGDVPWTVSDAVAKTGSKSFNISGLGTGGQSRLELTETITEPTELSFSCNPGRGAELSFFVNRDLQDKPLSGDAWQDVKVTLQPGTYTFTWLATNKTRQTTPAAIDDLRIGSVSAATWEPVGTSDAGSTSVSWTPQAATDSAAVRVRADNGHFAGDWVTGPTFPVTAG